MWQVVRNLTLINRQLNRNAFISTGKCMCLGVHYAGGPRRPPPAQLQSRRSRDRAHASIPLAQTPWGLTGRAWLQSGAQQAVIAIDPSFNSLGIDSRNDLANYRIQDHIRVTTFSQSRSQGLRANLILLPTSTCMSTLCDYLWTAILLYLTSSVDFI